MNIVVSLWSYESDVSRGQWEAGLEEGKLIGWNKFYLNSGVDVDCWWY